MKTKQSNACTVHYMVGIPEGELSWLVLALSLIITWTVLDNPPSLIPGSLKLHHLFLNLTLAGGSIFSNMKMGVVFTLKSLDEL